MSPEAVHPRVTNPKASRALYHHLSQLYRTLCECRVPKMCNGQPRHASHRQRHGPVLSQRSAYCCRGPESTANTPNYVTITIVLRVWVSKRSRVLERSPCFRINAVALVRPGSTNPGAAICRCSAKGLFHHDSFSGGHNTHALPPVGALAVRPASKSGGTQRRVPSALGSHHRAHLKHAVHTVT